jgi:outer membrane protein TolC
MMQLTRLCATLATLLVAAAPMGASGEETVDRWISEALTNNATLGSLQSTVEAARAGADGSGLWADPVVKYGIAPETLEGPNMVGHRFEISQALPWPDQLSAAREAADANMKAASQDRLWQQRTLVASVKEVYVGWWYSGRAIELHHENRDLVMQLADITRQQLDYGKATLSDLLRIQTELDSLDAQLVALEADRAKRSASLIPLLGHPPEQTQVTLTLSTLNPQLSVDENHPLVLAAEARLARARARLAEAEADRRPSFTASAGYNSLWADESKRWVVGIGVQVPLSGQRQSSAAREATAQIANHRWQALQTRRDLEASVAESSAAITAAQSQLDILNTRHLPNQKAHWEATLNELASGTGRLEDAIASARQLTQVELKKAAVIRELYRAGARYEALIVPQIRQTGE